MVEEIEIKGILLTKRNKIINKMFVNNMKYKYLIKS